MTVAMNVAMNALQRPSQVPDGGQLSIALEVGRWRRTPDVVDPDGSVHIQAMSDRKKLWLFFVLELTAFFVVMAAFRYLQPKLFAGAVGGLLFVSLGLFVSWQCWLSPRLRRSPTFIAALVHLFLTSLPLAITRLLNYSMDFGDVRVLGLSGPVFHGLSSVVYLALMMATLFDLIRNYRAPEDRVSR